MAAVGLLFHQNLYSNTPFDETQKAWICMEVCPLLYLNLPVFYQGLISTLLSVAPQHINGRGEGEEGKAWHKAVVGPVCQAAACFYFLRAICKEGRGFCGGVGVFLLLFRVAPPPSRQLQSSLSVFWQAGYDEQERRDNHTCRSSFMLMQDLLHLIIL